jgi:uncharacterized protein (DUF1684 family)
MRPVALAALLAALACHPAPEPHCSTCVALAAATAQWQQERLAALRGEQGWLALAGLHWLADGEHRLGADPNADIVFPAGAPADIGTIIKTGDEVRLRATPGVDVRLAGAAVTDLVLRPDTDRVQVARFTFLIIARGGRLGVRLYDPESPDRRAFTGIPAFPVSGEWQISARFEPYDPPRLVDHPTVLGTAMPSEVPGVAVFTIAGREHRLTPIREKGEHGDELLFVFSDLTSGAETYRGGRFLIAELPRNNTVALDFNRAHNPPCAFTPYATCPVPLPENRLQIRVPAGEQTPAGH